VRRERDRPWLPAKEDALDEYVRLGPSEVPPDRAFTDPGESAADLVAIRVMATRLAALAAGPAAVPEGPIICDERALRMARDLAFVGFFALKRAGLDHSPLTQADDELIGEFGRHPGILSYSSLELPDGNWANLILLDPPEARDHWRQSLRHAHAAAELAPRHYTAVRLHHGVFPGGLLSGADAVLVRTRYLDFRGPAAWRAERLVGGVW
jgi:hypothetical protein